jgi:restriction system protein
LRLSPSGFERLAQRVLREAGFTNVTVTGRSGDGGIDGVGTYRLSLVSFPVYFQCKRYRGSVPSRDVRDFRGALVGRGEKGLFITTGSFTREAQREANREGATPIELIDGPVLCDLLKEYRLGVSVIIRTVEDVSVRGEFFDDFN